MITIKVDCDRLLANWASMLVNPQLVLHLRSDELQRDHSWTQIGEVAHQGALPLDDCHVGDALVPHRECMARCVSHTLGAATEVCATNDDTGSRFLSCFSRLVIPRRETTQLFFAPGEMIQPQLGDELILVSSTATSRARDTRRVENRRLSGLTILPPALTPRCAGTSGDRPDLPADDWTAPSTTEPVAAAAIGSLAGSFAGVGAPMRSDSIVRQRAQKT